jgi:hypothetical protein
MSTIHFAMSFGLAHTDVAAAMASWPLTSSNNDVNDDDDDNDNNDDENDTAAAACT